VNTACALPKTAIIFTAVGTNQPGTTQTTAFRFALNTISGRIIPRLIL
jgi:hypothetical protein